MKDRLPFWLFCWDCFRWRFVALFYLAWWLVQGLPVTPMVGESRWQARRVMAMLAWSQHRRWFMDRHYPQRWITLSEWLRQLEQQQNHGDEV